MTELDKLNEEVLIIKRKTLIRFKVLLVITTIVFSIFLVLYSNRIFNGLVSIIILFQFINIIRLDVLLKKSKGNIN